MTISEPQHIVKTSNAEDLLALVPTLAGFAPRDSIVFVAFRGKRTAGALRIDLPHTKKPAVLGRLAASMVGVFCKIADVDGVVPVIYTDAVFGRGGALPSERFALAVIERAERAGYRVLDALCVASDGWGSYLDPYCPVGGRPLRQIADSTVNTELSPEVRRGDRAVDAGSELPSVDLASAERVARLLRDTHEMQALGMLRFPSGDPIAFMEELWGTPLDRLDARADTDGDSIEIALGIAVLQRGELRDAVLLLYSFGPEEAELALTDPVAAASVLMGEGRRPDPDRIVASIELLRHLTAHAPRSARPPLLTVTAWLCWAIGRSSLARAYLAQVTEIDERYGLAELIRSMIDVGRLPEWAFSAHPPESDDQSIDQSIERAIRDATTLP